MDEPTSYFDRVISRQRPAWVQISVSLLLLLLPFIIAYLSNVPGEMYTNGNWRYFLLTPAIIIYIWLISPLVDRQSKEVVRSLQALSTLDEESFSALSKKAQRTHPRSEWIAIGVGMTFGLVINSANDFSGIGMLFQVYFTVSLATMYGMLAWVIYGSVINTRMVNALFRQPLRVNIFNPAPFEAVGRMSLMLAMVFIGGITLSLVLSFRVTSLTQPLFWLIYLMLVLTTLLIFFSSMRPAHRLLEKNKDAELSDVRRHLERLGQELLLCIDRQEETSTIASEINALGIYEQRLQGARTWPYNTGTLRTLFFSVLMPLGSVVVKMVMDIVLE